MWGGVHGTRKEGTLEESANDGIIVCHRRTYNFNIMLGILSGLGEEYGCHSLLFAELKSKNRPKGRRFGYLF